MESGTIAIVIAGLAFGFNVVLHLFGGGWSLSKRLTAFESAISNMQIEIKKLGDVLVKMADMRGELRVLDTRIAAAEQDIRELRHGDGFIRGRQGVDREYP